MGLLRLLDGGVSSGLRPLVPPQDTLCGIEVFWLGDRGRGWLITAEGHTTAREKGITALECRR